MPLGMPVSRFSVAAPVGRVPRVANRVDAHDGAAAELVCVRRMPVSMMSSADGTNAGHSADEWPDAGDRGGTSDPADRDTAAGRPGSAPAPRRIRYVFFSRSTNSFWPTSGSSTSYIPKTPMMFPPATRIGVLPTRTQVMAPDADC